jgi:hypothetical protein
VSWSSTISYGGVIYSVPHRLIDTEVWVRVDGDEIVVTQRLLNAPAVVTDVTLRYAVLAGLCPTAPHVFLIT